MICLSRNVHDGFKANAQPQLLPILATSVKKIKEIGGKKRRGEGDYTDEDIDKYLGLKDRRSSKKFKRRWDHITAIYLCMWQFYMIYFVALIFFAISLKTWVFRMRLWLL